MCGNDQNNCRDQKPYVIAVKQLFQQEKGNSAAKKNYGQGFVMMLFITVVQSIHTNNKGQPDHTIFEEIIVNNIDPENG